MAFCKYALPDSPGLKNGRKIIAISGASDVWQIECNHNWMSNQLHFQDLKLCGVQFVFPPLHKQVIFLLKYCAKGFQTLSHRKTVEILKKRGEFNLSKYYMNMLGVCTWWDECFDFSFCNYIFIWICFPVKC